MKRLRVLGKLYASGNTQGAFVEEGFAKIKAAIKSDKMHGQTNEEHFVLDTIDLEKKLFVLYHQGSVQMTVLCPYYFCPHRIVHWKDSFVSANQLYDRFNRASFMYCHSRLYGRRWTFIGANVGCECMFIVSFILLARFPLYNGPQPRSSQSIYVGPLLWVIPSEVFIQRPVLKEYLYQQ